MLAVGLTDGLPEKKAVYLHIAVSTKKLQGPHVMLESVQPGSY